MNNTVNVTRKLFTVGEIVSVQDPIRLNEYSEPEPDVALLQPRTDFYIGGHPEPEDILLVVADILGT